MNFNKSEEIVKWRQPQVMMNYNHGENTPVFLSHQHQPQQQGETPFSKPGTQISSTTANSINSPLNNKEIIKTPSKFYITLAKESPKPNRYDENDSDSTATYDSYHDRATDICMDPCDTESSSSSDSDYSIESRTVEEVVEYEVASASASEDLYSNDSSSGTDGDLITTEIVECEVVSPDKHHGCRFWSSDFADTENNNSDNCFDSELSPADYWKCVKCKNHQNNPKFRYCEKCYQIRKTHFPPRPKQRKKRKIRNHTTTLSPPTIYKRRLEYSSSPTSNSEDDLIPADNNKTSINIYNHEFITKCNPDATAASTSNDEIGKNQLNIINSNYLKYHKFNDENSKLNGGNNMKTKNSKQNNSRYKKRKLNYTNNNISQLNSAAETSSSDNDDDNNNNDIYSNDSFENSSNFGKKFTSPNKNSDNINNLNFKSANIIINNSSLLLNRKRKASVVNNDGDDIDSEICSQPKMKYVNSININKSSDINLNLINSETDLVINNSDNLCDKDSGISSTPSTQDFNELITELSQPHNSSTLSKLQKNNSTKDFSTSNLINENDDDGNESSDTIPDELNEKDIIEIQKNNELLSQELNEPILHTTNISKTSINNNLTTNEFTQNILINLDRHISEFPSITINKINHDSSLIPRSISVNSIDPFKTDLRTIESPQSPSNAISLKNNCTTTNFADKLSSYLNPSDNQFDSSNGLCIICVTEPKNGAFIHSRFIHLSCCYKCAVKIWNKNKKCPICNCAVKNVLKLFVH